MSEQASIEIPTHGMHCRSCEALIELTVSELDGVVSVKADRVAEATHVEYDPSKVDVAALVDAIRSAGYQADLP
ncbi:MAG: heavy metal-associated domain-containing protein [Anaerosomatales bacterium]|nr:heavy metal-associated domain-containing protein [Anaerosomatales bacterium]